MAPQPDATVSAAPAPQASACPSLATAEVEDAQRNLLGCQGRYNSWQVRREPADPSQAGSDDQQRVRLQKGMQAPVLTRRGEDGA